MLKAKRGAGQFGATAFVSSAQGTHEHGTIIIFSPRNIPIPRIPAVQTQKMQGNNIHVAINDVKICSKKRSDTCSQHIKKMVQNLSQLLLLFDPARIKGGEVSKRGQRESIPYVPCFHIVSERYHADRLPDAKSNTRCYTSVQALDAVLFINVTQRVEDRELGRSVRRRALRHGLHLKETTAVRTCANSRRF